MSYSVNVNDEKIYVLSLGNGPTQGLDNTLLTSKVENYFNLVETKKDVFIRKGTSQWK